MTPLRFTLLTDGPTDSVLVYPLRWLLINNGVLRPIEPKWADLRQLPIPPKGLDQKIKAALDLYPCELLFVHRDAERESREKRISEIRQAFRRLASDLFTSQPHVCVVPVRMTEAWFLFDEAAIRRAAGNPAGRVALSLPPFSTIESLPDPKEMLNQLLKTATELPTRRLRKFSSAQACHRLAELIDDFSLLRHLPAFSALETDLQPIIEIAGWQNPSLT